MTKLQQNDTILCKIKKGDTMQVIKNYNSEYPVGILWNMGNKYAREMMLKIAIMEDVLQVRILDLGEKYEQFVLDCYKGDDEAYEGGYIYEKIKNMNTNNKKIIVFVFKVDNPTYQQGEDGKIQCIEARQVKQRIRGEYAPKIDGYFFDNLIHISDNVEESKRTLNTVNEYEEHTIGDYVRRGYKSILKQSKKYKNKSYVSFLEDLREEKDKRE